MSITLSTPVPVGQYVTATATDANNNTSDFSTLIPVTANVSSLTAAGFRIDWPTTATASNPFSVTVTALDANNNTLAGYSGTVHFDTLSTKFALPPDYKFTTGTGKDNGVRVFTNAVSLNTTGSQFVGVRETATGVTGQTDPILVSANVVTHFRLDIPSIDPFTPNQVQEVVPARPDRLDTRRFRERQSDLHGDRHFRQRVHLPAARRLFIHHGLRRGQRCSHLQGQLIFNHVGLATVTVTDKANPTIMGQTAYGVSPGPADHYEIDLTATVQPGQPLVFTVFARDKFNATATGYTGRFQLTSSAPSCSFTAAGRPGGAARLPTRSVSLLMMGSLLIPR